MNTTMLNWLFPLKMHYKGITSDSESFRGIDSTKEVELPVLPHCGAFGAIRRHDVHKGIDLYAPEGEPVYAVEDGIVVEIRPFTGQQIGMDWWNDTDAITIAGKSGNVVYGEIKISDSMKYNKEIKRGDLLGYVKQVLKKDKGRPMSMLHFALHKHDVMSNGRWDVGKPQPLGLDDPTELLINSDKHNEKENQDG